MTCFEQELDTSLKVLKRISFRSPTEKTSFIYRLGACLFKLQGSVSVKMFVGRFRMAWLSSALKLGQTWPKKGRRRVEFHRISPPKERFEALRCLHGLQELRGLLS